MITVVGVDGVGLNPQGRAALADAEVVAGWPRHLELVGDTLPAGVTVATLAGDLGDALAGLTAHPGEVVLLASGDPGFFGVLRAVRAHTDDVAVVPAVSSVAAAFAAAGVAWDDAQVVSAHGRDPHRAVAVCRRLPKVAVLTAPAFGPAALGAALSGLPKRLVVAQRLGHPDAQVSACTPAQAAVRTDWHDPNVVVVLDDPPAATAPGWAWPTRVRAQGWALPEDAFAHRDGIVTKAEVRALALGWLGPGLGDLVWDVGSGSGSVAVECARLGAAVIAVDMDAAQCARTAANAEGHGVPVDVRHGSAPNVLADLPDPDAVFIGGGGADLEAIVAHVAGRVRRSVVVALATLDRITPTLATLEDAGLSAMGTQVQAARLAPLGDGRRLAATNPIVLLKGARR